jgi:hypothetical protein
VEWSEGTLGSLERRVKWSFDLTTTAVTEEVIKVLADGHK